MLQRSLEAHRLYAAENFATEGSLTQAVTRADDAFKWPTDRMDRYFEKKEKIDLSLTQFSGKPKCAQPIATHSEVAVRTGWKLRCFREDDVLGRIKSIVDHESTHEVENCLIAE